MNIEEKVKDILFELSGEEINDLSVSLADDLALDSLSMVTLLLEIEEVFVMELLEQDMNPYDLVTGFDIVSLVERYIGDEDE